mgnify:CR=1 FL=1
MKKKIFFLYLPFLFFLISLISSSKKNNCIKIDPGGYSGFWYFYKKINNENIEKNKFICSSSSCLSFVSSIPPNNYSFIIDTVFKMQRDFFDYKIERLSMRERFIREITVNINNITKYNINILTTDYKGFCISNYPNNKTHLIELLLVTSNIPYLTGYPDFKKNLDGGICIFNNPSCNKKINLPLTPFFLRNLFNPYLSIEDIQYIITY